MPRSSSRKNVIMVRELRRRDFNEAVSNYYGIYDEVKRNSWVGIVLFDEKPSMKEERKWFRDTFKRIRAGTGFTLVAEVDGKVVGITDVQDKMPQLEQRHIGYVGIMVIEGYRSMGVGTALLTALIEKAKAQGRYELLVLSLLANNKHAYNLYRKMGFVEFGSLPNGIKRNGQYTNETYMYRKL